MVRRLCVNCGWDDVISGVEVACLGVDWWRVGHERRVVEMGWRVVDCLCWELVGGVGHVAWDVWDVGGSRVMPYVWDGFGGSGVGFQVAG